MESFATYNMLSLMQFQRENNKLLKYASCFVLYRGGRHDFYHNGNNILVVEAKLIHIAQKWKLQNVLVLKMHSVKLNNECQLVQRTWMYQGSISLKKRNPWGLWRITEQIERKEKYIPRKGNKMREYRKTEICFACGIMRTRVWLDWNRILRKYHSSNNNNNNSEPSILKWRQDLKLNNLDFRTRAVSTTLNIYWQY